MIQYRVIDLRSGIIEPEQLVVARTAEEAATVALGMKVFRSGARHDLVCRVYWQSGNDMNMVRFYRKAIERQA